MTGEYEYIAIYSDGKKGSIIKTNNEEIHLQDNELWTLDNLCNII